MKKLAIVVTVLALNGCAIYDALMMTNYDPNEYMLVTQIRTNAQQFKTQCDKPDADKRAKRIAYQTKLFENYSEQIPNNENGKNASEGLNEIAQGLAKRYNDGDKVSPAFCKLKFEGIQNSADTIRHVIANRPR